MTELDALVLSAAPDPVAPDLESAWLQVKHRIANETDEAPQEVRPSRWRGRKTRVAVLGAAFVVAAGGAAAAAEFITTHTGKTLTGWERDAGGPGEVLNMGGTDRQEVFSGLVGEVPFPDQESRDRALAMLLKPVGPNASISSSAANGQVADVAICAWSDAWAGAVTSGDAQRAARDADVLRSALSWSAVRTLDDQPSMTGYRSDQGRQVPTRFGHLQGVVDAIDAGSVAAARDALASKCAPEDIPHLEAGSGSAR